MQISTITLDLSTEQQPNTTDTNAPVTNTDFSKALASTECKIPTAIPTTKLITSLQKKDNFLDVVAEEKKSEPAAELPQVTPDVTPDNNPFLSQIALLQQTVQPPVPVVTEETQVKTDATEITNTLLLNKPKLSLQTPAEVPLKAEENKLTTDHDKKNAALMKLDAATRMPHKEMQNTTLPRNNQPAESSLPEIAAVAMKPLTIDMKETMPESDDNKAIASLNQLGTLLQTQVTQQLPRYTNELATPSTTYANTAREVQQSDVATQIEILPQTLGAHLKDTYNANIKLYPPELGHIVAKLKIDKNSAELIIMTESNVVKSIVESNLKQLHENFQKSDIQLTQVTVQVSPDAADMKEGREQKNSQNPGSSQTNNNKELAGTQTTEDKTLNAAPKKLNNLIDAYI